MAILEADEKEDMNSPTKMKKKLQSISMEKLKYREKEKIDEKTSLTMPFIIEMLESLN
jgi:hypothetical protein